MWERQPPCSHGRGRWDRPRPPHGGSVSVDSVPPSSTSTTCSTPSPRPDGRWSTARSGGGCAGARIPRVAVTRAAACRSGSSGRGITPGGLASPSRTTWSTRGQVRLTSSGLSGSAGCHTSRVTHVCRTIRAPPRPRSAPSRRTPPGSGRRRCTAPPSCTRWTRTSPRPWCARRAAHSGTAGPCAARRGRRGRVRKALEVGVGGRRAHAVGPQEEPQRHPLDDDTVRAFEDEVLQRGASGGDRGCGACGQSGGVVHRAAPRQRSRAPAWSIMRESAPQEVTGWSPALSLLTHKARTAVSR